MALYYEAVHSHVLYHITCWGQSARYIRVFRAQGRIMRMITNPRYDKSCRKLFKAKKVLSLISVIILKSTTHISNMSVKT
nr:unnamed protein product [Callosobruchus analis]